MNLRRLLPVLLIGVLISASGSSSDAVQPQPSEAAPMPGLVTPRVEPERQSVLPALQTVHLQSTHEDFLNPGRGMQRSYEGAIGSWNFIHDDQSTPRRQMYLPVTEGDLPESLIEGVRNDLRFAYSRGVLVDLRFSYSRDFNGSEPSFGAILRHQRQLAPVVHEYAFIVNTLALGLIGPWGEGHSVRAAGFGESDDAGAYPKRLELMRGWLNDAPPYLVVTMRYPHQLRWMSEEGGLTAEELARTGLYNDGFLRNDHHDGTFRLRNGVAQLERDKAWYEEYSRTHHSRAESNVSNSGEGAYARNGANWIQDGFARYHVDTLREWGLTSQVLNGLGVAAGVQRSLGYRLVLESATLPQAVRAGDRVEVQLSLVNEGYAPPRRDRVPLLMFGNSRVLLEGVDVRSWGPGRHNVTAFVTVPDLPPGSYELSLALPDAIPGLRLDPRYSVRLANRDVWDASAGVNRLHAAALIY